MRPQDLFLKLEPGSAMLYVRVADAIRTAILDGRLPPASLVPGTRALAEMLEVNRQTVITALQRLQDEGWVVTEACRGAVVASEPPSGAGRRPTSMGTSAHLGFDLPSLFQSVSTAPTGALLLADGAPDPRLAPGEAIARGYHRAMQRHGPSLLQGRDPLGNPFLREQVAAWISERHGVKVGAERILITRGSRSAIALLASTIFRKGGGVLVESPGNRSAWEVFQSGTQMQIQAVRRQGGDLDLDGIRERIIKSQIRLLYLSARRQFPTGAQLSQEQAEALLSLAEEHRVAILEDDYDAEIAFEERRSVSLLSLDRKGLVIHLGSLSRLLAPGLRIAFLVVPAPLSPFLASAKNRMEEHGDATLEWAIGDLIRDGELSRHLRRTRKIYRERRDKLAEFLRLRLGRDLAFEVPSGGMGLWIRVREGLCAEKWIRSAGVKGLKLNPPSWFHLDEPQPAFRMGFAQADESELALAVECLAQARLSLG